MRKGIAAIMSILCLAGCKTNLAEVQYVDIQTKFGNMKVELFDDTPEHKINFLTLASEGKYDSLLFHRVIKDFMIQGGDPNSLNAPRDAKLGGGQYGENIDAEIHFPQHFHQKGALAAARQPDHQNPEKKSSGSQFYIVQGQVLTDNQIGEIETKFNNTIKNKIFYEIQPYYTDSLKYYQQQGMQAELSDLQLRIIAKVEEMAEEQGLFHFPDSVREVYKTVGGTPWLDGEYTIFGQVVEGLDVIDSIAAVWTDRNDRPLDDIRMVIKISK